MAATIRWNSRSESSGGAGVQNTPDEAERVQEARFERASEMIGAAHQPVFVFDSGVEK